MEWLPVLGLLCLLMPVAGAASASSAGYRVRPGFGLGNPGDLLAGGPLDAGLDTWLILPVVICLSQRLSHACLSISNYTVKLRMAH